MWAVMAAISVAGFAAFEAGAPERTPATTPDTLAKADFVGGVGTSDDLPVTRPATIATPIATPIATLGSSTPSTSTSTSTEPAPPLRSEPDDTWLPPDAVERWRILLLDFFPTDEVDRALRVMWCESRGEPGAVHPGSGAAGLFQHLPIFWEERSAAAGFADRDIHDPEANIAVAGWLVQRDGWRHWLASQPCWDR